MVRKIAVPGTRVGFDFSSIGINSFSGIESRCIFSASNALPRTKVHIASIEQPAMLKGTHPPSTIFMRFAAKKVKSTKRKIDTKATAPQSGHFHMRQTTTKASAVVTTIVPETAMP